MLMHALDALSTPRLTLVDIRDTLRHAGKYQNNYNNLADSDGYHIRWSGCLTGSAMPCYTSPSSQATASSIGGSAMTVMNSTKAGSDFMWANV
jgi:hypothetical protein